MKKWQTFQLEQMDTLYIRSIETSDKEWISKVLKDEWGSSLIITCGQKHFADELPGFIAELNRRRLGLITYDFLKRKCEIITLNSFRENVGIGTKLLEAVIEKMRLLHCEKIEIVTTNDNLNALQFYQKRDFRIAAVFPGSVNESRKFKPSIPLVGYNGIRINDEIKLEMILNGSEKENTGPQQKPR